MGNSLCCVPSLWLPTAASLCPFLPLWNLLINIIIYNLLSRMQRQGEFCGLQQRNSGGVDGMMKELYSQLLSGISLGKRKARWTLCNSHSDTVGLMQILKFKCSVWAPTPEQGSEPSLCAEGNTWAGHIPWKTFVWSFEQGGCCAEGTPEQGTFPWKIFVLSFPAQPSVPVLSSTSPPAL